MTFAFYLAAIFAGAAMVVFSSNNSVLTAGAMVASYAFGAIVEYSISRWLT